MRLLFGHLKRMESVVQPPQWDGGFEEMSLLNSVQETELDVEWVELILSARSKGFSADEVKKMLAILKEKGQTLMQENAV